MWIKTKERSIKAFSCCHRNVQCDTILWGRTSGVPTLPRAADLHVVTIPDGSRVEGTVGNSNTCFHFRGTISVVLPFPRRWLGSFYPIQWVLCLPRHFLLPWRPRNVLWQRKKQKRLLSLLLCLFSSPIPPRPGRVNYLCLLYICFEKAPDKIKPQGQDKRTD